MPYVQLPRNLKIGFSYLVRCRWQSESDEMDLLCLDDLLEARIAEILALNQVVKLFV